MSLGRVAALVVALGATQSADARSTRRIAFASLAPDTDIGGSVDAARTDLAARGHKAVPPGRLREALEAPLPPADQEDTGEGSPLARGRQRIGKAREAYASFDYERALTALDAVDEVILDREPSPPLVELLAERHLLAGLIHEGRKHPSQARESFRLVHHLDPARISLDAGEYRPQAVALYEEAVRGAGQGALRVVTDPPGARIWIDGKLAGESPLDIADISLGRHWVVATDGGREPRGQIVDVIVERRRTLRLELERRKSSTRVVEVRRNLLGARSGDEVRAAAAQIAGAAEVDALILVRVQAGRVQGAVYDTASGELGPWMSINSPRLATALEPVDDGSSSGGAIVGGSAGGSDDDDGGRAWYSTGWGKGALIAGGVLVTGAILYLVFKPDDAGYQVGDFCFAGQDCQ